MSHREHAPGAAERGNDWLDGALAGWLLFIAISASPYLWRLADGVRLPGALYAAAPVLAVASIVPLLRFHRAGWFLALATLGLMGAHESLALTGGSSRGLAAGAFLAVHAAGIGYLLWIIPEFWPSHGHDPVADSGSSRVEDDTESATPAAPPPAAEPGPADLALAAIHRRIVAAGSACAVTAVSVRAEAGRFGVTPVVLRTSGLALYRTFLHHFLADGALSPDEERELVCLERALDLDDDGVWRLRGEAGLRGGYSPAPPAALVAASASLDAPPSEPILPDPADSPAPLAPAQLPEPSDPIDLVPLADDVHPADPVDFDSVDFDSVDAEAVDEADLISVDEVSADDDPIDLISVDDTATDHDADPDSTDRASVGDGADSVDEPSLVNEADSIDEVEAAAHPPSIGLYLEDDAGADAALEIIRTESPEPAAESVEAGASAEAIDAVEVDPSAETIHAVDSTELVGQDGSEPEETAPAIVAGVVPFDATAEIASPAAALFDYEEHELGALLAWAGIASLPADASRRAALERLRALHRIGTEPLEPCEAGHPLEPGERCLAIHAVELYRPAPGTPPPAPAPDIPGPVLDPRLLVDGSLERDRDLSALQRAGACRFLLTERRLVLIAPSGQQSPLPVSRVHAVHPFRNGLEVRPQRGAVVFLAFRDGVADAAMRIDRVAHDLRASA